MQEKNEKLSDRDKNEKYSVSISPYSWTNTIDYRPRPLTSLLPKKPAKFELSKNPHIEVGQSSLFDSHKSEKSTNIIVKRIPITTRNKGLSGSSRVTDEETLQMMSKIPY